MAKIKTNCVLKITDFPQERRTEITKKLVHLLKIPDSEIRKGLDNGFPINKRLDEITAEQYRQEIESWGCSVVVE